MSFVRLLQFGWNWKPFSLIKQRFTNCMAVSYQMYIFCPHLSRIGSSLLPSVTSKIRMKSVSLCQLVHNCWFRSDGYEWRPKSVYRFLKLDCKLSVKVIKVSSDSEWHVSVAYVASNYWMIRIQDSAIGATVWGWLTGQAMQVVYKTYILLTSFSILWQLRIICFLSVMNKLYGLISWYNIWQKNTKSFI